MLLDTVMIRKKRSNVNYQFRVFMWVARVCAGCAGLRGLRLRIRVCRLRIVGCRLLVAGSGMWDVSCSLWVAGRNDGVYTAGEIYKSQVVIMVGSLIYRRENLQIASSDHGGVAHIPR